jgi:rubredoxin-NAD+ reductase
LRGSRLAYNVNRVVLSNGETIDCGILIIAIGCSSQYKSSKKAGIKTTKGIIINEYMPTSVKDVYMTGDCVKFVDILLNEITKYRFMG